MLVYLTSFYPLCCTSKGKEAIKKFSLPNYIDGSCRREPDFENEYPCITSLCRPGFAEKLEENNIVIYTTNKKGLGFRYIVAILIVVKTYSNHKLAAEWYIEENLSIPNNLMVKETEPFPLDKTHNMLGWENWANKKVQDLKTWDNEYKTRAKSKSKVARCEVIYKDLRCPIKLSDRDWENISNRKLCSQNPPILKESEKQKLFKKINLIIK